MHCTLQLVSPLVPLLWYGRLTVAHQVVCAGVEHQVDAALRWLEEVQGHEVTTDNVLHVGYDRDGDVPGVLQFQIRLRPRYLGETTWFVDVASDDLTAYQGSPF